VQFNGTGGLWRRSAIERAGGWATGRTRSPRTSICPFRAHEAGLRGLTLPALAISTELPESVRTSACSSSAGCAAARSRCARSAGASPRTRAPGIAFAMLGHLARHARQPILRRRCAAPPAGRDRLAAPIAPDWVGPTLFAAVLARRACTSVRPRARSAPRSGRGPCSPLPSSRSRSASRPRSASPSSAASPDARAAAFVRTQKRGEGARVVRRGGVDGTSLLGAIVGDREPGSRGDVRTDRRPTGLLAALTCAVGAAWLSR
jgi:hypothetical protein